MALLVAGVVVLRGSGFSLLSGRGPACAFDTKSDPDKGPGQSVTSSPSYKVNPPAGGQYTPEMARPGAYGEQFLPPDGQVVKAMAQGYVVLWYRPGLDLQSLAALQDLAFRHAKDVLTVPRPSLGRQVAATAWHARLQCRSVDVDDLEKFVNTRVNQGPEKVVH